MDLTRSTPGLRSLRQYATPILLGFVGLGGVAAITALLILEEVRLAVTLTALSVLVAMAMYNIRLAIVGSFVYLTFMGDLRRILLYATDWSGQDPLLLVGPIIALLLGGYAILSGAIKLDSPIAKLTLAFMAFMTLQIFNPKQGGLMVGIAGAMLYLVPMLWFWVGRAYASKGFLNTLFYRVMPVLAGAAALMGFYQTAYGYLPYQLEWYRVGGYGALGPREELLRPLSVFPNLTEYVRFLGLVVVFLVASVFKGQKKVWPLILFYFLAIFLTGTRGPVAFILLAATIMWTVMGRGIKTWVPRLALALVVGIAGLFWALPKAGEIQSSSERIEHVTQRQANLVESSGGGTVYIHLNLLYLGFKWGFEEPLGRGIGSTTLAAAKFGSGGGSTEKDISDMFVAGGVIGGALYLLLVIVVSVSAVRYWMRTRNRLALAIIGFLVFASFGWLKSGQYVLTPITWFTIGTLDKLYTNSKTDSE